MAISGMSMLAIPMVSLSLNLLATSVSSFNFIRNRHAKLKLVAPFIVSSMPMAYLGGSLQVSAGVFYWILLISLIFVAMRIYFWHQVNLSLELGEKSKLIVSLVSGAVLGLIAGIVGIGGGVYLVPLIIVLGLGTQKQAAACGAIFVWLNSVSGLLSRYQHNSIDITEYLPLIIAVLVGASLGSFLGSYRLSPKVMDKILGLIVVVAIGFLLKKLIF